MRYELTDHEWFVIRQMPDSRFPDNVTTNELPSFIELDRPEALAVTAGRSANAANWRSPIPS